MLIDDPTGTPPPEGYPTYDSPVVQAVAAELLGRPYDDAAYWHKPHESNRASALHAAVRAVHAVLQHLGSQPVAADEEVRLTGELRATTDTPVRVLRPGSKVGRTLYDAETGDLVGMVDTPELAEWLCETVWREVRSQALREGEQPIRRDLCERLDARYGIESRGDEPSVATEGYVTEAPQPSVAELAEWASRAAEQMVRAQSEFHELLARIVAQSQ